MDFPSNRPPPPISALPRHLKREKRTFSGPNLFTVVLTILAGVSTICSFLVYLFGVLYGFLPIFALSVPTNAWLRRGEAITGFGVLLFEGSMAVSVVAMVAGYFARRRGLDPAPVIASLCVAGLQLLVVVLPYLDGLVEAATR